MSEVEVIAWDEDIAGLDMGDLIDSNLEYEMNSLFNQIQMYDQWLASQQTKEK